VCKYGSTSYVYFVQCCEPQSYLCPLSSCVLDLEEGRYAFLDVRTEHWVALDGPDTADLPTSVFEIQRELDHIQQLTLHPASV